MLLLLLLLQVVLVVITVKTIVSGVSTGTSASSDIIKNTIIVITNIHVATFTGTIVTVVEIFQHVGYMAHDDGAKHVEMGMSKVWSTVDECTKTENERV